MSVRRPGLAIGVETLAQRHELVGRARRPELAAQRVLHAREELHVGAVEGARALADPQQVGRAVVPLAGQAVAPREALLVGEHETFVARPQVDFVQGVLALQVDAAGRHEAQRVLDAQGDRS